MSDARPPADPFEELYPDAARQAAQQSTPQQPTPDSAAQFYGEQAFQEPQPVEVTNKTRGGDFMTRLQAGMKVTEKGKLNYLLERYGKGNVTIDPTDGSFVVRDQSSGETFKFDPKASDSFWRDIPGDVADVAGDVAEGVVGALPVGIAAAKGAAAGGLLGGPPGAIVGGAIGAIGGGAAGGALANVARQGSSAMVPGDDELTPATRGAMVRDAANMGMAAEAGGRLVGKTIDAARNLPRRAIVGKEAIVGSSPMMSAVDDAAGKATGAAPDSKTMTDFIEDTAAAQGSAKYAQQGRALQKSTGVEFTAGQMTGSRDALNLEGMLAKRPGSADTMWEGAVKRARQLEEFVNKQIDKMGRVGGEAAGEGAATAFEAYVSGVDKVRKRVFSQRLGKAVDVSKGQSIMPLENTLGEIERLKSDFSPAFYMASADKVVSTLDRIKSQLMSEAVDKLKAAGVKEPTQQQIAAEIKTTVKSFQRTMANLGNAASGKGTIIADLADPDTQRVVATRLLKAMRRDLDGAIADPATGDAAQYLKEARDAYRTLSEPVENAKKSILSKALKLNIDGAPDKIAQRMVSPGWSNVQVRDAMKLLNRVDKDKAKQLRAAAIEEMLGKAESSHALASAGVELSPAKFASVMAKNNDRLVALFTGDTKGLLQFKKAVLAARRLADTADITPGGSHTAPALWYKELADSVLSGGLSLKSGATVATMTLKLMGPKKLARTLSTPEGRDAFLQLANLGESKKVLLSAAKRIWDIQQRDERLERMREEEQRQAQQVQGEQ